ncbi:hypothetical protein Tco_0768023, partial [Tanacetum coccineum]
MTSPRKTCHLGGQGSIRSPGYDARAIAKAADRAKDVCY